MSLEAMIGSTSTPSASPTTAWATSAQTLVDVTILTVSPDPASPPLPSAFVESSEQATSPMVRPTAAEAARAVRRKGVFMRS